MTTGFILNYENTYEIQVADGTYKQLAAGITNVSWSGNEVIDQSVYYDGEGMGSTDVTGGQLVATVSGHRKVGDAAQDYIFSLDLSYGEDRKTQLRWTKPDGRVLECSITIANIEDSAGDANAKDEISFEMHVNGRPTVSSQSS